MKARTRIALAIFAGVGLSAAPLTAQRPPRGDAPRMEGRGAAAGPPGGAVERILQARERLALSEDQIARLNTLRLQSLEQSQAAAAQMRRLRSDVAAGERPTEEAREAAHATRDQAHARGDELREAVQSILTDEQKTQLRERMTEARRGGRPGPGGDRPGARFRQGRAGRGDLPGPPRGGGRFRPGPRPGPGDEPMAPR